MILYNVDNINIPFDKNWQKVAISLSGGADSALLAYIVCTMIIEYNKDITVHVISHTRMWKTRPWQQYDSVRIFNWLSNRFKSIKFVRHTNFVAPDIEYGSRGPMLTDEYGKHVSGDNAQMRAFSEYICHTENIDAYYNAVTRNPKDVNFNGMPERDIDPTEENQHLVIMKHMGRWALHPFRFTDKSWILQQYSNLDIMDLFNMTRSCEGEFKDINYQTYIPGQSVPTCNVCFWCKERNWAIQTLG